MATDYVKTVQQAQHWGTAVRPQVSGFPYYAEALRASGITSVETSIAAGGSVYYLADSAVAQTFDSLAAPVSGVPRWDEVALIAAIRADQAGRSTFPEFLAAAWEAGVIHCRVDLANRTCTYFGVAGNRYIENYPAVVVGALV